MYYAIVWLRVLHARRVLPRLRAALDSPPPASWPSMCIVVPAHNEEDVIEGLARSLLAQDYPALRLVFALDRCTDDTERRLRAVLADNERAEVVTIDACPEGWAGKTHALHAGVTRSRGAAGAALLLFADADTLFDPALCRAAVGTLVQRDLGLLSLLAELSSDLWFERTVQPAAGFELIRQHPLDIVNRASKPRAFANGQFMLFRREVYDRLGGHALVKGELLEDIAFARHMNRRRKRDPARWGVLMSDGLLACRMYRSWDAFQRGWKRIYTEAASRKPRRLTEWAIRQLVTGIALPGAALASIGAGVAMLALPDRPLALALLLCGFASLLTTLLALTRVYRDQGLPARCALTYPFGALWVARLMFRAARDLRGGVATQWGGRSYTRPIKP
ncbi:MAG TPA: hypothetical protein DEB06_05155 [Phycisphaerales bacterium]|nr:hypothetical protein [Phycisphaerales bacterium]